MKFDVPEIHRQDTLVIPQKYDPALLDITNTFNAQSVDLKKIHYEDVERSAALGMANDPYINLSSIAVAGLTGGKIGATAGSILGPVGTVVGSLLFGSLATVGAMAGLDAYNMSDKMSKLNSETRRNFLNDFFMEEFEWGSKSDYERGVAQSASFNKLPEEYLRGTLSEGAGRAVGMLMAAGALSTSSLGFTKGLAAYGKANVANTFLQKMLTQNLMNSFVGGLSVEAALSDYNTKVGMSASESEAYKSALGAGVSTFASSLIFMKATPYVLNSVIGSMKSPVARVASEMGKETMENVGWAITSNSVNYGYSKLAGIENPKDVVDGDEIAVLGLAGLAMGALSGGGSVVMRGMKRGYDKGLNRFAKTLKEKEIIKGAVDVEKASSEVRKANFLNDIRLEINPDYKVIDEEKIFKQQMTDSEFAKFINVIRLKQEQTNWSKEELIRWGFSLLSDKPNYINGDLLDKLNLTLKDL